MNDREKLISLIAYIYGIIAGNKFYVGLDETKIADIKNTLAECAPSAQ